MQTNVDQPAVRCAACGRAFKWKETLAGRTMRCPCGTAVLVPAPPKPADASAAADSDDFGEYDFAPASEPPKPCTTLAAVAASSVGLAAAAAGAADTPQAAGGATAAAAAAAPAVAAPRVTVDLPPRRKGLRPEPKSSPDEAAPPPSPVRDFLLPAILIPVGIILRVVEVSVTDPQPISGAGPIAAAVALKLALSVGLMLGGMFLAVQVMEVCFIGALSRTVLKLVAIAVAPGAVCGILTYYGGPTYGSMLGTFASVVAFGVLFWLLMRLDLKDAGICVLVTWILITAANYAAYRAEGLIRDSWV